MDLNVLRQIQQFTMEIIAVEEVQVLFLAQGFNLYSDTGFLQ